MPRYQRWMLSDGPHRERIMGKLGRSYTVEQLHRLLQEFGVTWTKNDRKPDLIEKLYDHCQKHPRLTERDRIKILNCRLDVQPIRYQVFDEKGRIKIHSYPTQLGEFVEEFIEKEHKVLYKGNARGCPGCKHYVVEINFPHSIGSCCERESNICLSCIEKNLEGKISKAKSKDEITCPMCEETLPETNVKAVTRKKVFKKYSQLF